MAEEQRGLLECQQNLREILRAMDEIPISKDSEGELLKLVEIIEREDLLVSLFSSPAPLAVR